MIFVWPRQNRAEWQVCY